MSDKCGEELFSDGLLIPGLHFEYDESIEHGMSISHLINKVAAENRLKINSYQIQ